LPEKPHIVVFDLGKVLLDFDYSIAAERISARGKCLASEANRFIAQSPLLFRYETGLMTREEFYKEVCAVTGYSGSLQEFGGYFSDIFTPIEAMVRIHAQLRHRGVPSYVFSNTNDLAISHIRGAFPFFGNFDGYILSYEHRAMKPNQKLYEVVERQSGKRGREIVYLDDRPENIETGATRGWHSILHETPEKSRAALRDLGLL
jgi:HAD superfamily hydrolase (TIGR01509 family)